MGKASQYIFGLLSLGAAVYAVPQSDRRISGEWHGLDSLPPSADGDSLPSAVTGRNRTDTLELPGLSTKNSRKDSISREFRKYWAELEKREGIDELRKQLQANDIDRTWVPRLYFFDSNLVVFPGWFVLRKKLRNGR